MKTPLQLLLPALAAALLGAGCIAIPCGTEKYSTEYPAEIRPTSEPPIKSYKAEPAIASGDENRLSVAIGIKGEISTQQPMVQTYKGVEVVKKKRFAIGLFPEFAPTSYQPDGSLTPVDVGMYYTGNGKYSTNNYGTKEPCGAMDAGKFLSVMGLLSTPFSLLAGIFGPFEHDYHFLGGTLAKSQSARAGNSIQSSKTYDSDDIDLLRKFPMSDREKIGAWTYHENATHPQNTFWRGFDIQWFGVYKYCNYFVNDLGTVEKTSPADPKVSTSQQTIAGPYSVVLSLPELGYSQTYDVDDSGTDAKFGLVDIANGDAFANGTVRFLPPPGGLAAVPNDDDRAILELAMERDWPVTVALPAPRLANIADGGTTEAANDAASNNADDIAPPYQFTSIEPKDEKLVVRVSVTDTSKTLAIDPQVRPEVRRLFREQFATGENAARREKVTMSLVDGGKTLVYTVEFE